MKQINLNQSLLLLGVALLTCAPCHISFAEGGDRDPPGAHGVNRCVRSERGYSGVKGSFVSNFDVSEFNSSVKSSPSFYFGGEGYSVQNTLGNLPAGGLKEVDAGLQFDSKSL